MRVATASVASGGQLSTVSCAVGAEANSPVAPTTAIPLVAPIPSVFWPFGDVLGEQELTEQLRHFYILLLVLTDDSRYSNACYSLLKEDEKAKVRDKDDLPSCPP